MLCHKGILYCQLNYVISHFSKASRTTLTSSDVLHSSKAKPWILNDFQDINSCFSKMSKYEIDVNLIVKFLPKWGSAII